jgi:glycosyltransferase involved in cell wall biosynthesis
MAEPMKGAPVFWYLHPFRFPADHAHSVQILQTCRALAEEGAQVTLFVKQNPEDPVGSVEEGLRRYGLLPHPGLRITRLPGKGHTLSGLALRWKIRRTRERPVFYARHFRLAVTAAGRGRVVVEVHALEKGMAKAMAAADGIVAITRPLADLVVRTFSPRAPVTVIPDAADLSGFPPVRGEGPPRLVYTGQFHEWKGVDVLIRALGRLPGIRLLIVGGRKRGDPARRDLEALSEREGTQPRIEWAGYVPQAEIPWLLRGGDIGVVPTRAAHGQDAAASPLKLFEYMASALPIIASDLPSIRDVIRPGENGLLFQEGNPEALAECVRRLIEHPRERAQMAERARLDSSEYTWRARARHILEFVRTLSGEPERPG